MRLSLEFVALPIFFILTRGPMCQKGCLLVFYAAGVKLTWERDVSKSKNIYESFEMLTFSTNVPWDKFVLYM